MKSSRKKSAERSSAAAARKSAGRPPSSDLQRWLHGMLLAILLAAITAMPLVVSEGAIAFGTHLPNTMMLLVVLVGWSMYGVAKLRQPVIDRRIFWLAAGLTGWQSLSALVHLPGSNGRLVLNALWLVLGLATVGWLVMQMIVTARQVRAVIAVMISIAVLLSIHAIYQYAVSFPQLRSDFAANRASMVAGSEQDFHEGSPEFQLLGNRVASPEPLATFALTNSLAGYLAPWLIAAALISWRMGSKILVQPQKTPRDHLTIAWIIISVPAIAASLFLTKSRTALLACLIGGWLVFLFTFGSVHKLNKRVIGGIAVLAVVALFAVFGLAALDADLWQGAPKSLVYRLEYWHSTIWMIAESPLFGCGPGNFQDYYTQFKLPQASETVADPHNFIMEITATAGLPALLMLMFLLACMVRFVWQAWDAPIDDTAETSQPAEVNEVWPIYAGAILGPMFAWPFGILVGYAAETVGTTGIPVFILLGLPGMAFTLAALYRWVQEGEWSLRDCGLVLSVLLINLLAAGSTSFPGVMVTAWVVGGLIAGRAARTSATETTSKVQPSQSIMHAKVVPWGTLAIAVAIAVGCYQTGYQPVLQGHVRVSEAEVLHSLGRAEQAAAAYRLAAKYDSWSPTPWQGLAMLEMQLAQASQWTEHRKEFNDAAAQYIRRAPHTANAWFQTGTWQLLIYRATNDEGHLKLAAMAYSKALKLYPNDAFMHAQLAWVYHLQHDEEAAESEAREALRLDDVHSHSERKLTLRILEDAPSAHEQSNETLPRLSAREVMEELLP